jgi:hypothetical protein
MWCTTSGTCPVSCPSSLEYHAGLVLFSFANFGMMLGSLFCPYSNFESAVGSQNQLGLVLTESDIGLSGVPTLMVKCLEQRTGSEKARSICFGRDFKIVSLK